jgi:hypothetical protein
MYDGDTALHTLYTFAGFLAAQRMRVGFPTLTLHPLGIMTDVACGHGSSQSGAMSTAIRTSEANQLDASAIPRQVTRFRLANLAAACPYRKSYTELYVQTCMRVCTSLVAATHMVTCCVGVWQHPSISRHHGDHQTPFRRHQDGNPRQEPGFMMLEGHTYTSPAPMRTLRFAVEQVQQPADGSAAHVQPGFWPQQGPDGPVGAQSPGPPLQLHAARGPRMNDGNYAGSWSNSSQRKGESITVMPQLPADYHDTRTHAPRCVHLREPGALRARERPASEPEYTLYASPSVSALCALPLHHHVHLSVARASCRVKLAAWRAK